MTKKDLAKSVLNKIKKQKLKPIPKWRFILKNVIFWGLYVLALILGGLTVSVVMFKLQIADWDLHRRIAERMPGLTLKILPLFWIVLFGLLLGASYYNLRHTKKGYSYKFSLIVVSNLILSLIIGSALHYSGASKKVEYVFLQYMPFYENLEHPHHELWSHPEHGMLAGKIIAVNSDNTIIIIDFKDANWIVELEEEHLNKKFVKVGKYVKILGEIESEGYCEAEEIKPWKANIKKRPEPLLPPPKP